MRLMIFSAVLLMMSQSAFADSPWYEGGTLQKATVTEWKAAAPENQLATAGDFIASMSGVSDIAAVTNPDDAARIKKKAEDLRSCVNQSINADTPADQPVANTVVLCTVMKQK